MADRVPTRIDAGTIRRRPSRWRRANRRRHADGDVRELAPREPGFERSAQLAGSGQEHGEPARLRSFGQGAIRALERFEQQIEILIGAPARRTDNERNTGIANRFRRGRRRLSNSSGGRRRPWPERRYSRRSQSASACVRGDVRVGATGPAPLTSRDRAHEAMRLSELRGRPPMRQILPVDHEPRAAQPRHQPADGERRHRRRIADEDHIGPGTDASAPGKQKRHAPPLAALTPGRIG